MSTSLRHYEQELQPLVETRLNDVNARLSTAFQRLRRGVDPSENDPSLTTEPDAVRWSEAMLHDHRSGTLLKLWPHQAKELRLDSSRIIHQDGRETGKTVSLVASLLHYACTTQRGTGLVATPHMGSLDTIIDYLEEQLDDSAFLAINLKIVRQPYMKLTFNTGTVIHFRPAGAAGEAFRSLHVERIWVDEGAWLTPKAWKALGRCLLPNGKWRIYSNPNGQRDTDYYRFTQSQQWTQVRWPSWIAPTWSPEQEAKQAEFYGGKDTPGWQHEVAGEHGSPSYPAFDPAGIEQALVAIEDYTLRRFGGDVLSFSSLGMGNHDDLLSLVSLLDLPERRGVLWFGADLGYTSDPAEIVMLAEAEDGCLSLVLRLHLEHVPYPVQAALLAALSIQYRPEGIGVDQGGNGMAVVQELTGTEHYAILGLAGKLCGYDFGGSIVVGEDENGDERKAYTKEHMTALINEAMLKGKLRLPDSDHELENQIRQQSYTRSDRRVVYSKGNDHINDALRCALLRRDRSRGQYLTAPEPLHIGMATIKRRIY